MPESEDTDNEYVKTDLHNMSHGALSQTQPQVKAKIVPMQCDYVPAEQTKK